MLSRERHSSEQTLDSDISLKANSLISLTPSSMSSLIWPPTRNTFPQISGLELDTECRTPLLRALIRSRRRGCVTLRSRLT